MNGLSRVAVAALGVAFALAIVGAVLIENLSGRFGDTFGFVCVLAGVRVAALTDTTHR